MRIQEGKMNAIPADPDPEPCWIAPTLFWEYLVEKVVVQALGDEGLHVDLKVLLELGRLTPAPPSNVPAGSKREMNRDALWVETSVVNPKWFIPDQAQTFK